MFLEWTGVWIQNPSELLLLLLLLGVVRVRVYPSSHLSLTLPWLEPAGGSPLLLGTKKTFQNTPPALSWPVMTSLLDLTREVLKSESPARDHTAHTQTCLAHTAHRSPCECLENSPAPLPLGRYKWAAFPRTRGCLTLELAHCCLPFAFSCSSSSAIVCS